MLCLTFIQPMPYGYEDLQRLPMVSTLFSNTCVTFETHFPLELFTTCVKVSFFGVILKVFLGTVQFNTMQHIT